MKLTRLTIRRIIKQELNAVLKEMKYPGGHPDDEFLRKVRRDDAGISSALQQSIKNLEKDDPTTARELASGLGSQESSEAMPDDPESAIKLLNQLTNADAKILDYRAQNPDVTLGDPEYKSLISRKLELEDKFMELTGGDDYLDLDDRVQGISDFKAKLSKHADYSPLKVFDP